MSENGSFEAGADRVGYIDGLRGLAAVIVVCRHWYMHIYEWGVPRFLDVLGLGYLGVHLFLLLSGYCVSAAYLGKSRRTFRAAEFAQKRATRILPAYYVALAISALLAAQAFSGSSLSKQLVTHATMTHNFFPSTVLALNSPFWSLALECQLYLLFPFVLIGFRTLGIPKTLGIVLVCQMVFRFCVLPFGTDYSQFTFVLPWSAPGRLFEFSLGMWAASLVARNPDETKILGFRRFLPAAMVSCFAAGWLAKRSLGVTHPITDLFWSLGFFCALVVAAHPQSSLHKALSWRPLVRLGVFSYSLYLVHELVIGPVNHGLVAFTGRAVHPLYLGPLTLGITVGVGYAFYLCIEKPAMAFFRTRLQVKSMS